MYFHTLVFNFMNIITAFKRNNIVHKLNLCLLILISLAATNASLLLWKDNYVLTKNDFKGKIEKNSKFQANTSTSIKIRISIDDTVKTTVMAYFDKQKSWIKPETPDKVLEHERLHFAITEIYAREIRSKINEIKVNNNEPKTQKIQITYAYQNLVKKMAEEQALYDLETQHSINEVKQLRWKNKINKRLFSLINSK